jgi:hypothetical protein
MDIGASTIVYENAMMQKTGRKNQRPVFLCIIDKPI